MPRTDPNYLKKAGKGPEPLPDRESRPLLVILDLNGTLLYRKQRKFPPRFARRPGVEDFLETLFARHNVMIWSSSRPETINYIVKTLLTASQQHALVAEWGRDKLGLTQRQYSQKVQVYKVLDKVWKDKGIQSKYPSKGKRIPGNKWDQTNTILVDDSKLKAVAQPYNLIEIPEFNESNVGDEKERLILQNVLDKLDLLSQQQDVSRLIREWQMEEDNTRDPAGTATVSAPFDKEASVDEMAESIEHNLAVAAEEPPKELKEEVAAQLSGSEDDGEAPTSDGEGEGEDEGYGGVRVSIE